MIMKENEIKFTSILITQHLSSFVLTTNVHHLMQESNLKFEIFSFLTSQHHRQLTLLHMPVCEC